MFEFQPRYRIKSYKNDLNSRLSFLFISSYQYSLHLRKRPIEKVFIVSKCIGVHSEPCGLGCLDCAYGNQVVGV